MAPCSRNPGSSSDQIDTLALRPSDLDATAGTVRVPRGKTGHRTVGLDPEALAVVGEWATHRRAVLFLNGRRPHLFTLRGGALRPSYVRSMLKRLAKRAGVERRVHPHALRHTMAAELLREGASVRHIQLQLGHSPTGRHGPDVVAALEGRRVEHEPA